MIRIGDRFDLSAYVPTMFDCTVVGTALTDPLLGDGQVVLRPRMLSPNPTPPIFLVRETLLDPSRWSVRRLS